MALNSVRAIHSSNNQTKVEHILAKIPDKDVTRRSLGGGFMESRRVLFVAHIISMWKSSVFTVFLQPRVAAVQKKLSDSSVCSYPP